MGRLVPCTSPWRMLAQAYLSVIKHRSDGTRRKGGCYGPDEELIPITAPGGAPAAHWTTCMDWKINCLISILSWSRWQTAPPSQSPAMPLQTPTGSNLRL